MLGLCCVWTQMAESWPTSEMLSRGTRATFLCGIPIAFFSGLGVALSVLDDKTSSLVGVAISASLLPPAVNCGMMLIVAAVEDNDWILDEKNENTFLEIGLISLFLTIANVVSTYQHTGLCKT